MRKYLLLRMRARYWAENGWLSNVDRAYLRSRYWLILFNHDE